jgi:hypothetical protein
MIRISLPPGLVALHAFEVSLDEVARLLLSEVFANCSEATVATPQESVVALPEAQYNPSVRIVHLWEPTCRQGTTVLRANIEDGWPTLTRAVAQRHAWNYVKVRVGDPWDTWPICEFEWCLHGETQRFVRVMRDDPRWQFWTTGDQLPFEKINSYQRRRIRDRFSSEMLWSYVGALGWPQQGLWTANRCFVVTLPVKAG